MEGRREEKTEGEKVSIFLGIITYDVNLKHEVKKIMKPFFVSVGKVTFFLKQGLYVKNIIFI